jgi:hypothetical protein
MVCFMSRQYICVVVAITMSDGRVVTADCVFVIIVVEERA